MLQNLSNPTAPLVTVAIPHFNVVKPKQVQQIGAMQVFGY